MFSRWVEPLWRKKFAAPYVHLVFGARQTGKSTLLRRLLPGAAVWLDFSRPAERAEYLRNPDLLVQRCQALPSSRRPSTVVVDEAQNVPAIFDAVQHLYDSDKRRWRFVLCGSSARKLRVTGANLLPGRSLLHHLFPLLLAERPPAATCATAWTCRSGARRTPGARTVHQISFSTAVRPNDQTYSRLYKRPTNVKSSVQSVGSLPAAPGGAGLVLILTTRPPLRNPHRLRAPTASPAAGGVARARMRPTRPRRTAIHPRSAA